MNNKQSDKTKSQTVEQKIVLKRAGIIDPESIE